MEVLCVGSYEPVSRVTAKIVIVECMKDFITKMACENTSCSETDGKYVISGWASVPCVDRSNEYIDGRAYDLTEYKQNPVYLWCHDRKGLPLGTANVLAKAYDGDEWGLFGEFEHNPNYDFAMQVYDCYRRGYLKGFSAGFAPTAKDYVIHPESRTKVLRFTGARLFEISAVPIPDNALAMAVPVVKSLFERMPNEYREKMLATMGSRVSGRGVKLPSSVDNHLNSTLGIVKMQGEPNDMTEQKMDDTPVEGADVPSAGSYEPEETKAAAVKPGPAAFRALFDGLLQAATQAADMVRSSDHPEAEGMLSDGVLNILAAARELCGDVAEVWPEEGFDEIGSAMDEQLAAAEPEDAEDGSDDLDYGVEVPEESEDEETEVDAEKSLNDNAIIGGVTELVSQLAESVESSRDMVVKSLEEQTKRLADKEAEYDQVIEKLMGTIQALSDRLKLNEKSMESVVDSLASLNGVTV